MHYFEIREGLYRYLIAGELSVNLYGIPRAAQDIEMLGKARIYMEEKDG